MEDEVKPLWFAVILLALTVLLIEFNNCIVTKRLQRIESAVGLK